MALLRIAQSASPIDIKMAAVQALTSESALRQAEREFRSHDRKVHRLAKQRFEAAVTEREARAQAHTLLQRTRVLLGEDLVAVNHVVELDREWEALPARTLESAQYTEFAELRARLDAQMREQEETRQRLQRWTTETKRFLLDCQRTLAAAAEHGGAIDAAALCQAAQALRQPDSPATAQLDLALAQAVEQIQQAAALAQARLEAAAAAKASEPPLQAPPAQRPDRQDAERVQQGLRLDALVQQAEWALAEGHLGELQRHLQAIETTVSKTGVALPETLRARHQALWTEQGRLKDWQQWGGTRARDDLTAEAEELARQTLAAADPGASDRPPAARPKLNLKTHAESIQALRLRWRELDRLGAGPSLEQWQRFDTALQTAHQPVAALHAALKSARQANLVEREALLTLLEAQPAPASSGQPGGGPDWKECMRELDRFQSAWRKLGPVEHTAPSASRALLQQRLQLAVARIETPLQEVRGAAAAEREQLIARAASLTQGGGDRPSPDATRQVRDLQAAWQDQARRLPLPRGLESALWARFKSATDAVFALRDAAFAARDAELAANLARREDLLQRLSAVHSNLPSAAIERELAEVDRAWRQGAELPRGTSDALEGRFRTARATAVQCLSAGAQKSWQAQCDSLAAKVALCEEREDVGDKGDTGDEGGTGQTGQAGQTDKEGAEASAFDQRWALHGSLPAAWAQALAQRWGRPVQAGPLPALEVDDLLLQLENALDLPTAPEWQAAKQNLKLRALKEAMEGRRPLKQGPAPQAGWLLAAVRQSGLSTAQRTRLHALLAALRQAPPGALGSPANTA